MEKNLDIYRKSLKDLFIFENKSNFCFKKINMIKWRFDEMSLNKDAT